MLIENEKDFWYGFSNASQRNTMKLEFDEIYSRLMQLDSYSIFTKDVKILLCNRRMQIIIKKPQNKNRGKRVMNCFERKMFF